MFSRSIALLRRSSQLARGFAIHRKPEGRSGGRGGGGDGDVGGGGGWRWRRWQLVKENGSFCGATLHLDVFR